MRRVNADGTPYIPLNVTPGGPTSDIRDPYRPSVDHTPTHPQGSVTIQKEIGPFFWEAGYGRSGQTTPFNMELQYELDIEALKEWVLEHAPALAGAGCVGCTIGLTMSEPERYAPLMDSFGHVLQSVLSGVGDILKGAGEIIPG